MPHEFFGQKNEFGLELDIYDSLREVGKARLWIKEKQIGEYKVKHKISYIKSGMKDLLQNENELWDEKFEGKTAQEIATMCWMIGKDLIWMSDNEASEAAQFIKFSPYFGEQFDSACIIVYKRSDKFHFIWTKAHQYMSKKKIDYLKHLDFESIDTNVVKEVVKRFLSWYDSREN